MVAWQHQGGTTKEISEFQVEIEPTTSTMPVRCSNTKFGLICLFLGLRGPPLDENLLLSDIATANKKLKHLSEVGHHIVIKSVTGLFFNPNDCLLPALQQHLMKSANHNTNYYNFIREVELAQRA